MDWRCHDVRLARYRFRTVLAQRWTGYLTVVVLVGLLGGVALGSMAAARRTKAAFPVYLASTNPSNLTLATGAWQLGQPNGACVEHHAGARLVTSFAADRPCRQSHTA